MKCWLCRMHRDGFAVGAAHIADPDRSSMDPTVLRRGHGRHDDHLSRADRNRVRQMAHERLCAWVVYRTAAKPTRKRPARGGAK
jgi:hypothetical protein